MGKAIETIARERNHEIGLIIDIDNLEDFTKENLQKCDVAIEFTVPQTAYENFMKCFEANIPLVTGTTGWHDKCQEIVDYCNQNGKTFFYASNFSLGVNIFFNLNEHLARIMNQFPDYDVDVEEVHHIHKKDAPSGTAISLAEDIIDQLQRKEKWALNKIENEKEIKIVAKREDEVPGIHIVHYDSEIDEITIKHSAKSRKGFAFGAVLAAEYIMGKKGVFTMKDLLGF